MSWKTARHRDFTGGENRKVLPEFVKPNQVAFAQNCVLTAEGFLESREGKTKINSTSLGTGAVLGIWRWGKENGTQYLTVQHGTSLYNVVWDGVAAISSFGSAVKTGLSAGKKLRGVVWRDNLILSNGVDNPFRLDGSAVYDLAGTPPKFSIFTVYGGRLWVVPVTALSSLRHCGLEDFDSWNALDIYKIRTGDGDTITGLSGTASGLFISKLNTSWALYGTSRFDVQITTSPIAEVGCVSHDAMMAPGIFLGKDNFYRFSLTGVSPISETHSSIIQLPSLTDKKAAFGVVDSLNKRAVVQINDSNIFCIDGRYSGAITSWKNLNASCFEYAKAKDDTGLILVGDADNGWIYKLLGADDDGMPLETYIKSAYLDYGVVKDKIWRYYSPDIELLDPGSWQLFGYYDVDYKRLTGQNLYTGINPDYLEWNVDAWDLAVWKGAGGLNLDKFFFHNARGRLISFEIKSTNRFKYRGYLTKFREAGAL